MNEEMRDRYEDGQRPCLTRAEIERLAVLAEELGEAQQVVGKILRHGFFSYNPLISGSDQNYELLERELGDIAVAIDMLVKAGNLRADAIRRRQAVKTQSIRQWLHHQGEE